MNGCATRTHSFDAVATAPTDHRCRRPPVRPVRPREAPRFTHTYDAFGRTTAKHGTAIGCYANDLVRQQTTGNQRHSWDLNAAM